MTKQADQEDPSTGPRRFVFLLSPTGRSGTNYLRDLLVTAGVCQAPRGNVLPTEDWMLPHAYLLVRFADEVRKAQASPSRADPAELSILHARMLREFGEALKRTVDAAGADPVVLKTPSTHNIDHFFRLFGPEHLLLLVRDGRDVCESLYRSKFVDGYPQAFEYWNRMAAHTIAFQRSAEADRWRNQIHFARYEECVASPQTAVQRIASWLKRPLDTRRLPAVSQLPVIGSSEFGLDPDGGFSFRTVPAPPGFNPIGRWKHWPEAVRDQFKQIANRSLVDLGYEKDDNW